MCVGWTDVCAARIYLCSTVRRDVSEYRNLGLKSRRIRVSGGLLQVQSEFFLVAGGGGLPYLILKSVF